MRLQNCWECECCPHFLVSPAGPKSLSLAIIRLEWKRCIFHRASNAARSLQLKVRLSRLGRRLSVFCHQLPAGARPPIGHSVGLLTQVEEAEGEEAAAAGRGEEGAGGPDRGDPALPRLHRAARTPGTQGGDDTNNPSQNFDKKYVYQSPQGCLHSDFYRPHWWS